MDLERVREGGNLVSQRVLDLFMNIQSLNSNPMSYCNGRFRLKIAFHSNRETAARLTRSCLQVCTQGTDPRGANLHFPPNFCTS